MATSLRELMIAVFPKSRPCGNKKKFTEEERKHELSTKWDPSGFEYVKTLDEQQSSQRSNTKILDKLSRVSNARKKKKIIYKELVDPTSVLSYIPDFMHPFISNLIDVDNDGNCGYRCVAGELGLPEINGWVSVRKALIADLMRFKDKYNNAWGKWYYNDLIYILDWENNSCGPRHWMDMPVIGYLIASAYNCAVVFLSNELSVTFLPHITPSEESINRIIAFVHIRCNHFVRVHLKEDALVPPVASMWNVLRTDEAENWINDFEDRIDHYLNLKPKMDLPTIDFPITLE